MIFSLILFRCLSIHPTGLFYISCCCQYTNFIRPAFLSFSQNAGQSFDKCVQNGKCTTCSEECFSLARLNLIRQTCVVLIRETFVQLGKSFRAGATTPFKIPLIVRIRWCFHCLNLKFFHVDNRDLSSSSETNMGSAQLKYKKHRSDKIIRQKWKFKKNKEKNLSWQKVSSW